jgi:hypothetical protein
MGCIIILFGSRALIGLNRPMEAVLFRGVNHAALKVPYR